MEYLLKYHKERDIGWFSYASYSLISNIFNRHTYYQPSFCDSFSINAVEYLLTYHKERDISRYS